MRGESAAIGLFVDISGMLTSILYWAWLAAITVKLSILEAVAVFVAVTAIRFSYGRVAGPDRAWRWIIGLIAVWPLTVAMFMIVF
jgi:hypothetical protein